MDYHLHQQGQTDGVFPLEELRRRRQAGELAGTELVWCRGMAEWQALDTVLQQETPADSPATLAPAESESKLVPTLMMVAVVFGGVIVLTLIGFLILYGVHGLPPALREAVATAERPRRSTSALAEASKPIKWTTNSLTVTRFKVQMKAKLLHLHFEPGHGQAIGGPFDGLTGLRQGRGTTPRSFRRSDRFPQSRWQPVNTVPNQESNYCHDNHAAENNRDHHQGGNQLRFRFCRRKCRGAISRRLLLQHGI